MSMRDILGKLARIDESMKSDAKKSTGPKFPGYWKGTDKASQAKNKMVGGSAEESIIKDLERALTESPSRNLKEEYKQYNAQWCQVCGQSPCNCTTVNEDVSNAHDEALIKHVLHLAALYMQSENLKGMFSLDDYVYKKMGMQSNINEAFNSKQEVIAHFVKQGKPAAAGAAAWERGWRGPTPKAKPTKAPQTAQKYWWQDKEELEEYGGVGGYGAASQAPSGTTAQTPDPAAQQLKLDRDQIQKSTSNIASTLNQQGAAQLLNKAKFGDVMTKLDATPNTQLSAQELQQMGPMAVAASKALQNPQTAMQMKQLISKSDSLDKAKQVKVQQAQQQVGTNPPADQQNTTQPPSAGQTK
jgi:hypothetical protein